MTLKQQVFLGGTCGKNEWRTAFIETLVARGVPASAFFNPVVSNWDEAAQKAEDAAKAESAYMLFYISNPGTEGNQVSAYSLVEAVMGLYDNPDRTILVVDTSDLLDHVKKALTKSVKDLKKRFPNGMVLGSREEAIDLLASKLA